MQYTKEMFRGMFQASFDDKQWQEMLVEYFQATNIRRIPEELDDDSDDYEGYYLGSMQTSDNIKLGFFTYNVHGSIDRRKVGLRQIVKPYLGLGVDAALVVFNDGNHWRLSLICDIKEEATAPKRFTYVFGDPQNYYNTPVSRFMELQDKGISFANIKEAFSVEALSDEFFKEYKRQYEGFVEYITGKRFVKRGEKWVEEKQRDPHPQMYADFGHNDKLVRDYVKKLLGRIVFLHFLQKKGWLGIPQDKTWGKGDIQFILHLYQKASDEQKEDFLDTVLEPLFTAIDSDRSANNDLYDTGVAMNGGSIVRIPYLNGGLFERDSLDEIPTKFPQKLFADLLDFFYQYNFTIDENDPNDAQVGVDPEMLGRIFENLLEDNKDKGAYYTPKEIVRYMCCQSLTAYLLTDISDETERKAIENFVKTYDVALLGGTDSALAKRVDQQLKDVKICDPAIGSGAFPMGLLRELFLCRGAIEDFNDAADIKRHIIQNNIYGVDIERGAVDIARLRFWLSLIVDEDTPASLPNLDYKIMQGNSLLEQYKGVDLSTLSKGKTENIGNHQSLTFFDDMVDVYRKELKQMIESYYSEPDHTKKKAMVKKIHENILAQMQEQSINVDLSNIDIQSNDQFFLWHTWFADVLNRPSPCNGFDIVIGNPPYVEAKKLKYIASTLKDSYNLYSGTADFSVYFIEQAFRLLSPKGIASYITTNKFFNTGYGQSVRSLLSSLDINILLNFEQVEVFKDVLVSSVIFNIRKADSIRNKHFIYEKFYKMNCEQFKAEFVNRLNSLGKYPQNCLGDKEWSFVDTASLELQKKIEREATLLGKVGGVKIYRGVTTGYNPAFIISDEQRDKLIAEDPNNEVVIKNLLQGRNIRKWVYEESNLFLLQTGYDINIPIEYPYINNHLKNFEEELTKRADQGVNWWNLRACQYYPEFEKPEKIIWGLTAAKWAFAYDDKKHYLPSNGYILTSANVPILYLLGWLNSKLMRHYFHYIGVMTAGGAYTLKAATIESLPFKKPESTLAIENLVRTILTAKQQVPSADTSAEEQEIDRLVYKLYGLTYDEVKIVDPNTPITEEEYNKGED